MSVPICFQNIIGFTRKFDECVDDAWSDEYAESLSGLYIDELPGMPQRFIASLGGNYDMWEKMTNALTNAINTFKIDALQEILKYKEPARNRFKGNIGGRTFTNVLSSVGTYRGLRMFSDVRGGIYTLRGVSLILNVTEDITLEIYDEYDLLYSYALTSQAGRPKYTAITPLILSLDRNYYFLFTTTGSPYNNKLTCNCGGFHWCFCIDSPCYGRSRDQWTEWAMCGGVHGNDLTARDDWGTSRDAEGMILDGEFNCNPLDVFCDDDIDWISNETNYAVANAIWYKTGEFLANYILSTEEVSRPVLLGVEHWNTHLKFYNERYIALIEFIGQTFQEDRNECLKCRSPHGFQRRTQML